MWEGENQRACGVVMYLADLVLIVAMNMAVENCNVVVGRKNIHHVVAVAGEPLPIGSEVKQGAVREDDNRGGLRESRDVLFQPSQLFSADLRLGAGNIIQRDEMHAAMVK